MMRLSTRLRTTGSCVLESGVSRQGRW